MSRVELRRELRNRRAALAPELVEGWSAAIGARLVLLDEFRDADALHCYASSLPGEVRTDHLIGLSLSQRKRVICPRVRPHGQLEHREITSWSQLIEAAFGLREPDPELAAPADPAIAGLVLVPGVAFSEDGGRLGMGGGYYDRFLPDVAVPIVGLSYEMQLVTSLSMAEHDQSVDIIVTEMRVIRCR